MLAQRAPKKCCRRDVSTSARYGLVKGETVTRQRSGHSRMHRTRARDCEHGEPGLEVMVAGEVCLCHVCVMQPPVRQTQSVSSRTPCLRVDLRLRSNYVIVIIGEGTGTGNKAAGSPPSSGQLHHCAPSTNSYQVTNLEALAFKSVM
jgi:hypothetical protein